MEMGLLIPKVDDNGSIVRMAKRKSPHQAPPPGKSLNLALQGGGAHGAFTWGVLDRLLEEPDLVIAFHDNLDLISKGTKNMVEQAGKCGIPYEVHGHGIFWTWDPEHEDDESES